MHERQQDVGERQKCRGGSESRWNVLSQRSCFATLGRNVKRKLDSEREEKKQQAFHANKGIKNSMIVLLQFRTQRDGERIHPH